MGFCSLSWPVKPLISFVFQLRCGNMRRGEEAWHATLKVAAGDRHGTFSRQVGFLCDVYLPVWLDDTGVRGGGNVPRLCARERECTRREIQVRVEAES